MKNVLNSIFNFCASIKLAVINLAVFAALLSYATFYEAEYTTELAQKHIYSTTWFDLLIFFIGLNVACAALSRYPWKKKHTGFVITHAGILIILFGSMINRKFGIEGQIMLEEGQQQSYMLIPNDILLSVDVPQMGVKQEFKPWFIDSPIPEDKEVVYPVGDTGIKCYVERYVFDPRMREVVTNDGPQINPAVQVSVVAPNAPQPFQDWLFSEIPNRREMDLSVAKVAFMGQATMNEIEQITARKQTPAVEEEAAGNGSLTFKTPSGDIAGVVQIDDIINSPATFHYEGEDYTVRLIEFIPRAYIVENDLKNEPDKPLNPAAKFELTGPEGTEEHLPFALFPELGSFHSKQEVLYDFSVEFSYPLPEVDAISNQNRVELYLLPDNTLHYIAQNTAGKIAHGDVKAGEPFDTTWAGVMMEVGQLYLQARMSQKVEDAGNTGTQPHNNPLVEVRLEHNGDSVSDFVSYNRPKSLRVGGTSCIVEFGQRKVPVGFSLQLIDFRAPRYPGTNRPQRFESDVIMRDPTKDIEREQMVYMNHPLYHNGYAVYQASYIEGENGRPDISIFSVARAPGTITIYVGSIVMIAGMIIFYMSRKLYFPDKKEIDF